MTPEIGQGFEALDAKANKKVAAPMPEDADIAGVLEDVKMNFKGGMPKMEA